MAVAFKVSTHSRLEAADNFMIDMGFDTDVSTHSRLEAADLAAMAKSGAF